jgi:dolichyl-diphosphooligosaccharide--protein glycosyltransferase
MPKNDATTTPAPDATPEHHRATALVRAARLRFAPLSLFVLGLTLRTWPFAVHVFRPGQLLLYGDTDPYYHLRRIRLATQQFPLVPDFDPWLNFPRGAYAIWAPLFDWVPAALSRLTQIDPDLVATFWPALLGGLCCAVLFALLRRWVGAWPALLSSVLFALLPGAVLISALGRIDHHVAEVVLQLTVYLQLLRVVERVERDAQVPHGAALALGVLMAVAQLTWAGSLIFLWLVAAVLSVLALQARAQAASFARVCWIAFLVAAALTAPMAWLNLLRGRAAFASIFVSMLHVALCVVLAFTASGARALSVALRTQTRRQLATRLPILVGLLCAPWLVPGLRAGLLDGLSFVTREQSAWLKGIAEFEPLFAGGVAWDTSVAYLGYGVPALLLPIVAYGVLAWRTRFAQGSVLLALGWMLLALVLGVAQLRFSNYAAPVVAAAPALLWHVAGELRLDALGKWLLRGLAGLLLAAIAPCLGYWAPLLSSEPNAHVAYPQLAFPVFDLLRRLKAQTPPAGDPSRLDVAPSYGVMAPWDLGHWLVVIAERPAVATPFGMHLSGGGYEDAERLYEQIADEASAVRLLERRHCRYLITESPTPGVAAAASFANQLHASDGSAGAEHEGSGRLRLRLETLGLVVSGQPGYKVFELVPGAVLRFAAAPQAGSMRVQTELQTESRRVLYMRRTLPSARGGSVEVRVAYPGRYRVFAGESELGEVPVSERDVMQGRTLNLQRAAAQ